MPGIFSPTTTTRELQSGSNRSQLKLDRGENYGFPSAATAAENSNSKDLIAGSTCEHGEVTRSPCGGPAGSKNKLKSKPPIIITLDSANAFRSHVMEVANGCDVQDSISTFVTRCRRRRFRDRHKAHLSLWRR
ncbi:PREDICTED: AT-hook motif nuclear-localized protein 24-like [Erythranthe guttata]|uniref:AT-hook motif nuclear-localized protein 24-like n=1 Tax=Erythranthe guttata TaxID=4155 RepID=UPI00064D9852|nr:PREDICTED: AT-hook motif nuclear-localized protein 24-like [Erythranthe guttata]|eukprot:XP_012840083.1 PREDICTED: AT-hook motif nuclear-localized protein 24-like [Erythranthe guttata]